jgi:N-acetylmuramoyl-L-alanine amidase
MKYSPTKARNGARIRSFSTVHVGRPMSAKRCESAHGAHEPTATTRGFRFAIASLAAFLSSQIATNGEAAAEPRGLIGTRAAALDRPAPPLASGEAVQRAVATNPHLEDSADHSKLTFELTNPVKAKAFAMAEPDRIVIDLPEIDFHANPGSGSANAGLRRGQAASRAPARPAGLVASYRFGFFTAGKSRIVIDLAAPARIVRAESEKSADGSKTLLVVELAKTDQVQFRHAAQNAAEAAARAPVHRAETTQMPATAQKANVPVIALDAGHGGVDCGALANGLIEKDLVFEFAKALQGKLEASGRFKVVMTRDGDVFVPLADRVRIARDAGAQLFVSIHADTLVEAAGVSGATFYTVSDRASDAEAARTAEKENQADAAAGLDRPEDANGVSDILFDLTRRETRAYSHVFARTLVNYWRVAGRLNKNPERAAGFYVLKAPDVPSVLVELGYLSSDKDAASFVSAEWRDKTSEKIVGAIDAFFAARKSETRTDVAPNMAPDSVTADPPPPSAADSDLQLRGGLVNDVARTPQ